MTDEHQTTTDPRPFQAALSWNDFKIGGDPLSIREVRRLIFVEEENAILREQLAWCMPRLSRERYRSALTAFLAERGIIMVPPARDQRRDEDGK